MIRPRYLPDSIVAQLVSVFAFSHNLDPKATFRSRPTLAGAGHWGWHAGSRRAHFREGLETLTQILSLAVGARSRV